MWLVLCGVGAGTVGLLLGAVGLVRGCLAACFQTGGPGGFTKADEAAAGVQMGLGMVLFAAGLEVFIFGLMVLLIRAPSRAGAGWRRGLAWASCLFAGIGLLWWLPACLGMGPGALTLPAPTPAISSFRVAFTALAGLLCLASVAQIVAAAGVLRPGATRGGFLRQVTGAKLALYLLLWLVTSLVGTLAGVVLQPDLWVGTMLVIGVYYWFMVTLSAASAAPEPALPPAG
jgi:hypothetical protein